MRYAVINTDSTIEVVSAIEPLDFTGPRYCVSKDNARFYFSGPNTGAMHNSLATRALGGHSVIGDCLVELDEDIHDVEERVKDLIKGPVKQAQSNLFGQLPPEILSKVVLQERVKDLIKGPVKQAPRNLFGQLPSEILSKVVLQAGAVVDTVQHMSQVCHSWRELLSRETSMWQRVSFHNITKSNGLNRALLPWMLRHSIDAHNVSALVCFARYLDSVGCEIEAIKYWIKASKRGHPEAQWYYGSCLYKGRRGLQQDSEEAIIWLGRAAKQLLDVLETTDTSVEYPLLMNREQCTILVSQCAVIMGCIHLDGDGVKTDTTVAVKWLKVAHKYGCNEAGRMLGSLFRNGQY